MTRYIIIAMLSFFIGSSKKKPAGIDDLEDQLQMECSAAAELDYIITRNLKDFKDSKVPAVSSEEFLQM